MENYEFPEIYVEGEKGDYYIVEENGTYRLSREPDDRRSFGHILYEDVIDKAIDLVEAVVKKSVIVVPRFKPKGDLEGLLVSSNTPCCIIEVKSIQPYVLVNEGDNIEMHDKIAYMVTSKGEVRVYKSPCRGLVLIVANFPWEKPEKYILVVVSEDAVRRITIKRD